MLHIARCSTIERIVYLRSSSTKRGRRFSVRRAPVPVSSHYSAVLPYAGARLSKLSMLLYQIEVYDSVLRNYCKSQSLPLPFRSLTWPIPDTWQDYPAWMTGMSTYDSQQFGLESWSSELSCIKPMLSKTWLYLVAANAKRLDGSQLLLSNVLECRLESMFSDVQVFDHSVWAQFCRTDPLAGAITAEIWRCQAYHELVSRPRQKSNKPPLLHKPILIEKFSLQSSDAPNCLISNGSLDQLWQPER